MTKKKTPSRAGRAVRGILLGLIGLLLAAVLFLVIVPFTEGHRGDPQPDAADWMSRLADNLRLNEIAVPGTHDSGTQYVQLAFFSKCQAADIRTQLEDGFRYLDIRLGVNEKKDGTSELIFYHGFCRCRTGWAPWSELLTLDAALEDCYGFLESYPTETILFVVKEEQGNDTARLQTLLDEAVRKDPDKWLLTDRVPTLGEARGKLVLLRRYGDAAGLGTRAGMVLNWADQGGRADVTLHASWEALPAGTLVVQDRYKYTAEEKWTAFLSGMAEGTDDPDEIRLYFLSTNGSPRFGHPYKYAAVLNPLLEEADLSAFPPSWIIVDFADGGLASAVYSLNFR